MRGLYILDGREPRRVDDLMQWAKWLESADRQVMRSTMADGSEISTVFLGLDHSFGGRAPVLFETCVFLHENTEPGAMFNGRRLAVSDVVARYRTWAEAEVGHMEIIESLTPQLEKHREKS